MIGKTRLIKKILFIKNFYKTKYNLKKLKLQLNQSHLLKIAITIFLLFLFCLTFFLYSSVYGFSPNLKTEFLSKEIQNYIYYCLFFYF